MGISTRVKQMIVGPLLLLGGLVAIGFGIAERIEAGKLKAEGIATPGTVVSHGITTSRKGGRTYKVTVQYPGEAGGMILKEFNVSKSYHDAFPDGRTVSVRHLPTDPNVAELVGEEATGLVPIGIGTLMLLGGAAITRVAYQKPAPAPRANFLPT